jgi:hypothetical protein
MRLLLSAIAVSTRLFSARPPYSAIGTQWKLQVATTELSLVELGLPFIARENVSKYDSLVLSRLDSDDGDVTSTRPPLSVSWGGASGVNEKPFFIDFEASLIRRAATVTSELVVKAMGKSPAAGSLVWDLTAGLGRDAFLLAASGYSVRMYERNVILHSLLSDALDRLSKSESSSSAAISKRMFLNGLMDSSIESDLPLDRPDLVYLDPMYPSGTVGRKSAVKKETQMLRRLVGEVEASLKPT